jgi:hypothetical protein
MIRFSATDCPPGDDGVVTWERTSSYCALPTAVAPSVWTGSAGRS